MDLLEEAGKRDWKRLPSCITRLPQAAILIKEFAGPWSGKFLWRRALLLALVAAGAAALAGAALAQPATAKDAWVRAPAPGQKVAVAYMELIGQSRSALVSVASPVAARAELHRTVMEGGVMRMRPVTRIELEAGKTVKLEPGSLHVMLLGLRRALKPGEKVPIDLTVERTDGSRGTITVHADVRETAAAKAHNH